MKNSTEYGKRITGWWSSIRRSVEPPGETDPVAVLVLAILSRSCTLAAAQRALDRICAECVDFNELRVTPEPDIVELLGADFPEAQSKAGELAKSLGYLFETVHTVTLQHAASKNKKELRSYLLGIPGLNSYSAGVIMLQAFRQQAVPLDEAVLGAMQTEDLLPRDADHEELSLWLERHIDKSEAHAFWIVSKQWVAGEVEAAGSRKAIRKSTGKSAAGAGSAKATRVARGRK